MPHMEGEHEIHGLRFWDGTPTVRLLMPTTIWVRCVLERCEPGTVMRALPGRAGCGDCRFAPLSMARRSAQIPFAFVGFDKVLE